MTRARQQKVGTKMTISSSLYQICWRADEVRYLRGKVCGGGRLGPEASATFWVIEQELHLAG